MARKNLLKNSLKIRKATSHDSEDILNWRNDETTRKHSITTDKIKPSDHEKWFDNSLKTTNKFLYIGEVGDYREKIGICMFDLNIKLNSCKISINLNPKMRGLGLSERLLSSAITAFKIENDISVNLEAVIKKNNTPSIRCFQKCYFIYINEDLDYKYYLLYNSDLNKYY